MKSLKTILFLLVLALSYPSTTQGQILRKLKKKVQKAAEDALVDKAAEKTYQETGKKMDSMLEIDPDYEPKTQQHLQNLMMQGGSVDIPIEDVYQFNTSVVYKMDVIADGKPTSIDYNMWFSGNENYIGTKMENISMEGEASQGQDMDMFTILDEKNEAMIMIIESQKIAQILSMSKIVEMAETYDDDEGEDQDESSGKIPEIKKTGKTKNIIGYKCEEFKTETDDGKITFWVTKDVKLYQKNMFLNLNKSLGGENFKNVPHAAQGFLMEMHFENINENIGDKSSMVIKSISKKNKTINTKDYQKMNLSGFMK